MSTARQPSVTFWSRAEPCRRKPGLTQGLRQILHTGLAHEAHLAFDHETADEHGQESDERDEEVNLQSRDRDDESGHDAEDRPAHSSHRMSVQTRWRHRLSESFIGLELLFYFTQNALFVVRETHDQIFPLCSPQHNAATWISLWAKRRLPRSTRP